MTSSSRPLEWSEAIPCITNTIPSVNTTATTSKHVNPAGRTLQPVFSPNGKLVAAVLDQTTIVVRDSDTFAIVSYLQIPDVPSSIEFDPSGTLLLVCVPKRSCVSVFPVSSPSNASGAGPATLTETLAGVTYATWVKGRVQPVALVVSDFGCRMVAWDVGVEYYHDASAVELACPKVASGLGVSSSPDGSMVGVLMRESCKDRVVVYDAVTFEEVGSLELGTADAAGMLWSPDSKALAVWDGVTYGPRVVAVGVTPSAAAALHVLMDKTWSAGTNGLGVRTAAWSPSGSCLAVGTYDADVLLVNALTWKCMQTPLHHASVVDEKRYGGTEIEVVVFEESEAGHYVDANMPTRLPTAEDSALSASSALPPLMPTSGVERVLFSSTGKFLATVCPDKPSVLWIWDASRFELDTCLIHRRPIRDVAWRPGSDTCYLVCGTKNVFVFDDGVMTVLGTGVADERFKGMSVCWSKEHVAVSCGSCYSVGSCA